MRELSEELRACPQLQEHSKGNFLGVVGKLHGLCNSPIILALEPRAQLQYLLQRMDGKKKRRGRNEQTKQGKAEKG